MTEKLIFTIFFGVFDSLHNLVFALFWVCLVRVFLVKYSPYSTFYVASIAFVQAVFNGCPMTSMQNFLGYQANTWSLNNAFWDGEFGAFTNLFRVIMFFLSLALFYLSYKNWYKAVVVVDFGRIFQKRSSKKTLQVLASVPQV